MGTETLGLDDNLKNYLLAVSLHEPEACRKLGERTRSLADARMISSPEQVQLLLLLSLVGFLQEVLELELSLEFWHLEE